MNITLLYAVKIQKRKEEIHTEKYNIKPNMFKMVELLKSQKLRP
jgi:hypothetical protein